MIVVDKVNDKVCDMVNGASLAFWKLFQHSGIVCSRLYRSLGKEVFTLNHVVKITVKISAP